MSVRGFDVGIMYLMVTKIELLKSEFGGSYYAIVEFTDGTRRILRGSNPRSLLPYLPAGEQVIIGGLDLGPLRGARGRQKYLAALRSRGWLLEDE